MFADVAESSGVTFRHRRAPDGSFPLHEIMSGGGAVEDLDGDGHLDILAIASHAADASRIFWGRGDGQFDEAPLGCNLRGYSMGAALGDLDGDGRVDIYVTSKGPDRLLRNLGSRRFVDVSEAAGVGDPGYSASATWFDMDADGDLDLYVTRYIDLASPERQCFSHETQGRDYCSPLSYRPVSDLLLRNDEGRLVDVSRSSGVARATGYGLAVLASDLDGNGTTDVYVANDQSPAFLWANDGHGRMTESALLHGCALNEDGVAIAGMGIVHEDFDQDHDLDLFVTNIRTQNHLFFRQDAQGFTDITVRWGTIDWLRPRTGFGVAAFDVENDGQLELFIANGAVMALANASGQDAYAEPDDLVRQENGRFQPFVTGLPERPADVARGVVAADLDEDGDEDLVVFLNDGPLRILENRVPQAGHWIAIRPLAREGGPALLNTRVTVVCGARRRTREVRAQESYLVSKPALAHFGLGATARIDRIELRWPDGRAAVLERPAVNRTLHVWPTSEPGRIGMRTDEGN